MTVISSVCENNTLTLTLRIERGEFAKALDEAYMNDTEHYAVPGFAAGLAPREKIEELYGQTALFDEALDICVPRLYSRYLSENGIRTVGRPQLTAVTWLTGGGADFTVVCGVYPEVKLGEYKELEVNAKRDDEEAFTAAVLTAACTNMQAEVPESMVKQKLEAILAGDKMRVAQDPIYNVLADFTAILDEAYKQSDVTRSRAQVQAEALDVMLQTVSGDNREVSPAKLHELIRELVEHYRIVPRSFDEMLENIISERGTKKRAMTDEEKINDAFAAYLGTINQTEEMWRKDNTKRAEDAARFDLLLNAVAQAEKVGTHFFLLGLEFDAVLLLDTGGQRRHREADREHGHEGQRVAVDREVQLRVRICKSPVDGDNACDGGEEAVEISVGHQRDYQHHQHEYHRHMDV